jgi:drug/metabolite transporter (DMT)-like permease
MQAARIGIALFLFFLALIGVLAGISLLTGENDELSNTGELVVGVFWLLSAALFAAAGALLLRRPMDGRALGAIGAVLVVGGVLLTVNPYFGAPVTAGAALAAVLGFAR